LTLAEKTARALGPLFEAAGYQRGETDVLQPADVFLDFAGEDMRRRLFLTEGTGGEMLCLRPEFTIPLSRSYLDSQAALPANFYAIGKVFRQRAGESGEFVQVDVERFGHPDTDVVDAECLSLALDTLAACGAPAPGTVRIGDLALLNAMLDGLAISPSARRRLKRRIAQGETLDGLSATQQDVTPLAAMLAELGAADDRRATLLVETILETAGSQPFGDRGSTEIAERLRRIALGDQPVIEPEALDILTRYLAIADEPDAAVDAIAALAQQHGLDLGGALEDASNRIGFMAAHGVDLADLSFEAGFLRGLDYYTGFIFEVPGTVAGKPVIGGGRYDSLMRRLGAASDIPAIGFALWPERVPGGLSGVLA
jgi:ATP phosphoribosyltransferase regulatory subunit